MPRPFNGVVGSGRDAAGGKGPAETTAVGRDVSGDALGSKARAAQEAHHRPELVGAGQPGEIKPRYRRFKGAGEDRRLLLGAHLRLETRAEKSERAEAKSVACRGDDVIGSNLEA